MLKVILLKFVLKGRELYTSKCISAYKLVRNEFPTATSMFAGSNFSMALSVTLQDETGSQTSKIAAEIIPVGLYLRIIQLHVSQLIYMIAKKFQRLYP